MSPLEFLDQIRVALWERRHAYQMTFRGPLAEVVLKDLARFCRANETIAVDDPYKMAVAIGRREAWLRVQEHLKLTPDQLWELYSGRPAGD